jgi:hypothetical protein
MKRDLTALALFLAWSMYLVSPAYSAEGLSVHIAVEPEPSHEQIIAGATHVFNVSVANDGLLIVPGQPTEEEPSTLYTGHLYTVVDVEWRASGSYDFGEATTGYSSSALDNINLTSVFAVPLNGSVWVPFNHTFVRDAFDFGVKPYETLEVKVEARVYLEVYNESSGLDAARRGPLVAQRSVTLKLLDETKIEYVEGKLLDMAVEVEPLRKVAEAEHLNAARFLDYLTEMNRSIEAGDYFSALETYSKYDEKYRAQLISSLTEEASTSIEKTQTIDQLEQELGFLNASYTVLEDKYVTLSRTYQTRQAELEAAKQSLSTAITAVFLASIAFFFVGRRSVGWGKRTGRQTMGVEGD